MSFEPLIMNRFALSLLYLSGVFMFIGGLGDQFIREYLDVHLAFLGYPEPSELLERSGQLSMLMLHSAGGGLMSAGISMLALTHFGIRKNQAWAKWTLLLVAWIAQGINGYGMFSAGSYYWYPIIVLGLSTLGVVLYPIQKG